KYLNGKHSNADELKISPDTDNPPDLFLLGGRVNSALFAAEENVNYMFAHCINNDVELLKEVAQHYKEYIGKGKFIVAISVLVIEGEESKEAKIKENEYYQLMYKDGRKYRVITEEQAENFVKNSDEEIEVVKKQPDIIMGSPDEVLAQLTARNKDNYIDEFMFHLPTADPEIREQTLEALAP